VARLDTVRRVLDRPRRLGDTLDSAGRHPAFSPDGQQIAYLASSPRAALGLETDDLLVVQDLSGLEVLQFSPGIRFDGRAFHLEWDVDGHTLLAYGREKDWSGLYRVDVRTREVARFLQSSWEPARLAVAALSPDRESVLFSRPPRLPWAVLSETIASGDGRVVYQMEAPAAVTALAFSPDGHSLLVVEADYRPRRGLSAKLLPLRGGSARTLLTDPAKGLSGGVWLRDGTHVMCWANTMDEYTPRKANMWLIPVDGRPAISISNPASAITGLDVSRSGHLVAYAVKVEGTIDLWKIDGARVGTPPVGAAPATTGMR